METNELKQLMECHSLNTKQLANLMGVGIRMSQLWVSGRQPLLDRHVKLLMLQLGNKNE